MRRGALDDGASPAEPSAARGRARHPRAAIHGARSGATCADKAKARTQGKTSPDGFRLANEQPSKNGSSVVSTHTCSSPRPRPCSQGRASRRQSKPARRRRPAARRAAARLSGNGPDRDLLGRGAASLSPAGLEHDTRKRLGSRSSVTEPRPRSKQNRSSYVSVQGSSSRERSHSIPISPEKRGASSSRTLPTENSVVSPRPRPVAIPRSSGQATRTGPHRARLSARPSAWIRPRREKVDRNVAVRTGQRSPVRPRSRPGPRSARQARRSAARPDPFGGNVSSTSGRTAGSGLADAARASPRASRERTSSENRCPHWHRTPSQAPTMSRRSPSPSRSCTSRQQ